MNFFLSSSLICIVLLKSRRSNPKYNVIIYVIDGFNLMDFPRMKIDIFEQWILSVKRAPNVSRFFWGLPLFLYWLMKSIKYGKSFILFKTKFLKNRNFWSKIGWMEDLNKSQSARFTYLTHLFLWYHDRWKSSKSHALHGQPLLTMLKRFDWSTGKLNLKNLITDFEILKFLPSPGRPSFSRRSLSFEICCLIVVFETLGLVGFWFWGWFSDQGISLAISASTWSIRNIISYNQIKLHWVTPSFD